MHALVTSSARLRLHTLIVYERIGETYLVAHGRQLLGKVGGLGGQVQQLRAVFEEEGEGGGQQEHVPPNERVDEAREARHGRQGAQQLYDTCMHVCVRACAFHL